MFVDREVEIADLRRRLGGARPQLIRVYGRRRVGKTELLLRVCGEAKGLFLVADDAERPLLLSSLSRQVAAATRSPTRAYADWDDFLDHLEELSPPVVVLDEFQRILENDRAAASRLQDRWDRAWKDHGPSLVLCGSSIGMMQRLTHGRRGPLFGRLTGDLRVRAFEYPAVRLLYPGLTEEERVVRYAVFGGTPFYHTHSIGQALEEALQEAFLTAAAPLAEEPQDLLRLELRSPGRYNTVLDAIGQGAHALRDLEARTRARRGGLAPYLLVLRRDLDLLALEEPVAGLRRHGRHVFQDPFFAFYYRFVFPNLARIEAGQGKDVGREIAAGLDAHVGRVFERVAHAALRAVGRNPVDGRPVRFTEVGRWWNRQGEELDAVAAGPEEVWVGEVKWSRKPVDAGVIDGLLRKAALLEGRGGRALRPFVVARGGLTRGGAEALQRRHGFAWNLNDLAALFDGVPKKAA